MIKQPAKAKFHVIIPQGMRPTPERFELSAADILLGFFKADITFLPVTSQKTPDILVGNVRWEIKSPEGKGKRNIQHQLMRAMKQSVNIVFDARRSKKDIRNIRRELTTRAKMARGLKRLLLINKDGEVEVIK